MELPKKKWSESLKRIKPKVERILYKGNIDLLLDKAPKLAIVGSRRMSDYGQRVIEKWMPTLVQKGVIIVSGFMYGVDQTAHKTCLENGGKTIAVLGWGIDRKVAGEDEKLYHKILEVDSLIVSEYEGELEGSMWTFPRRNRIVAGIADAVLVVEAAERSGSLITANLALCMNIPLMAVPGLVTNRMAEGTNNLIKSRKAVMVSSADDVLREMNLRQGQLDFEFKSSTVGNPILEALENGEKSVDELSLCLGIPVVRVMESLLDLELEGQIEAKMGKYVKID